MFTAPYPCPECGGREFSFADVKGEWGTVDTDMQVCHGCAREWPSLMFRRHIYFHVSQLPSGNYYVVGYVDMKEFYSGVFGRHSYAISAGERWKDRAFVENPEYYDDNNRWWPGDEVWKIRRNSDGQVGRRTYTRSSAQKRARLLNRRYKQPGEWEAVFYKKVEEQ